MYLTRPYVLSVTWSLRHLTPFHNPCDIDFVTGSVRDTLLSSGTDTVTTPPSLPVGTRRRREEPGDRRRGVGGEPRVDKTYLNRSVGDTGC